ncbi:MAG: universal stress protein [Bacteroidota bacterium]|jgi:nucleotide-binding universal stress UspA family protein
MSTKKIQPKRKVPARKVKPVQQFPINIRRILVPIDFSEHSKNALKYAIPFAEKFKASIDLIYVVEPTIYPADFSFGQIGFPNVEEELRTRGSNELEHLVKKEIADKVVSRKIVRTGKPFYEINQYALEENMSLIIIATHGHTGMEHILFGSTAEKVVRKAPCPVLVVRAGEHEFVKV